MSLVSKKIWPEYFEKVLSGDKTFEFRIADFEINSGDTLVLKEWDPESKEYTGREIEKKVGYVAQVKDLWNLHTPEEVDRHGYQIISLLDL